VAGENYVTKSFVIYTLQHLLYW